MRLFNQLIPVRIYGLLLADAGILLLAYLLACLFYPGFHTWEFLRDNNGLPRIAAVMAGAVLGLYLADLYTSVRVTSRVNLSLQLCSALGVTLVFQGLLSYAGTYFYLPRLVMLLGTVLAFLALFGWRYFYSKVIWRLLGVERVLLIGSDAVVREIAERMARRPEHGFGVAGYLSHDAEANLRCPELGPWLGTPLEIPRAVASLHPHRIVVGMLDRRSQLPMNVLLQYSREGKMIIEDAATTYESVCGRVCSRDFRPSQFIFDTDLVSRPGSLALQSIYTNLVSLALVVVTLPFLILIGLVIRLTMGGPSRISETRLGQHGIPFTLNRFRTRVLVSTAGGYVEHVPPIGRLLERFHLDRLPILFNVLRGEMALVGPSADRPEYANQLAEYVPYYPQRQIVKPGLTGWSQIHIPASDAPDALTVLEYDLYYTKHISLSLDAYILISRFRQVLIGA